LEGLGVFVSGIVILQRRGFKTRPPPRFTDRSAPLDGRSVPTSRAPLEARANGKELFELVPSSRYDLLQWFDKKSDCETRSCAGAVVAFGTKGSGSSPGWNTCCVIRMAGWTIRVG